MINSSLKIAVTGPDKNFTSWYFIAALVRAAGAKPLRVTPKVLKESALRPDQFDFDGLILSGGTDINPKHYPEVREPSFKSRRWWARAADYLYPLNIYQSLKRLIKKPGGYDDPRDEMELAFLRLALEERKPVLGICRGYQLIQVGFGGALEKDVSHHYSSRPQARSLLPSKSIRLESPSTLLKILGRPKVMVNALHNQGVLNVAPGLRAVASEKEGLIQALEGQDTVTPVLGVQWHPEYLFYKKSQRRLFEWLVEEAGRRLLESESPEPSPELIRNLHI